MKIASSATISSPASFTAKLFNGKEFPRVQVHDAADYDNEDSGLEVLFFLQSPDGEKSPKPISTMIQTAMGIGHGFFSHQPTEEMDRALLFTDSIDNANRFQSQIQDAESNGRLWGFRTELNNILYQGKTCPGTNPNSCSDIYLKGECWRGIIGGINCTTSTAIRSYPMEINLVTSRNRSNYWEGEIVVATGSLEVGVDDRRIKSTLHYRPPRDVFSFIQRRGRAGRMSGDVAYSIMVLGNESSDQFYLYRRNRMLTAEGYELPLNPDNFAIAKMHDLLAQERNKLRKLSDSSRIQRGILEWLYSKLTGCSIIRDRYASELSNIQILTPLNQQKRIKKWIGEEMSRYANYLNIFWILEDIENQCPSTLKNKAREIKNLVILFFDGDKTQQVPIQDNLKQLAAGLNQLTFGESDPDVVSDIEYIIADLRTIWSSITFSSKLNVPYNLVKGLYDFFYYLGKIDEIWKFNYAPDVIKPVLQAFFYLGIETRKDPNHINCSTVFL